MISRVIGTLAAAALLAQAPVTRAVWVLEAPNRIIEYDAGSFAARRTVVVPPRVFEHPEYLRINADGQMLFASEPGVEFASGDLATAATRVWVWDGVEAHEFPREDEPDTARTWFLSSSGDALYAFENRFAITRATRMASNRRSAPRRGSGARMWRVAGARSRWSWRRCRPAPATPARARSRVPSGTRGRHQESSTGSCCSRGTSQGSSRPTTRRRRSTTATVRRPATLLQPIEMPLDASADGATLVAAIPDAGCCGWINASSDQLLALRGGRATTLFDEFSRFGNQDYDVSFVATAARLSPDLTRAAYTLVADAPPAGDQIRLSDSGTENASELARIRQAITRLPAVEIVRLDAPTRAPVAIPDASLAGWLGDDRLLVVQEGQLAVYSAAGAKVRDTGVTASANSVWLR